MQIIFELIFFELHCLWNVGCYHLEVEALLLVAELAFALWVEVE